MTVKEMIAELSKHDPELEVKIISCEEACQCDPVCIQDADEITSEIMYLIDTEYYCLTAAREELAGQIWRLYDDLDEQEKSDLNADIDKLDKINAVFIRGNV